jgi:hypothetical protein
MHGGKIFIRTDQAISDLPAQVIQQKASASDIEVITPAVMRFAELFDFNPGTLLSSGFLMLTPNAKNPYKQLYAAY